MPLHLHIKPRSTPAEAPLATQGRARQLLLRLYLQQPALLHTPLYQQARHALTSPGDAPLPRWLRATLYLLATRIQENA
ncbi:hypothetical protein SAMN02745857_03866 [Andreprevotia lacus DSM 23236]|jgi:hypothetical protein|uniref:Uncharacterized protein n=1 Tax=Andreprevotia lacus DSM 23236 TaxID=1121001 RepID=A0A1W1XZT2_9NEIS|nr:hypothetical protein [Andreprevotia lacus]SMC29479.1 hypothetical protein SAMN02745857_03866 [Andreprevotia lacus DSM 23236]